MTATFAALVAAHVLADFVLQTRWMVARKRHPGVLLLHGAIVLLTAQATLGLAAAPALLAVALAHVVIDAVKARATPGPGAFLADQSAHLAVLAAVAVWQPGLWQAGLWADLPAPWPGAILHGLTLGAGFILATRAGGCSVGLLMTAQPAGRIPGGLGLEGGLPQGGLTIGWLERGLIFILLLAGEPGAIGFLIAAKSVLRFGTVAEDRAASEYVIIGTLASFGWAIAVTLATLALRNGLPPLEIAAPLP